MWGVEANRRHEIVGHTERLMPIAHIEIYIISEWQKGPQQPPPLQRPRSSTSSTSNP
jgi:hypothetical protein